MKKIIIFVIVVMVSGTGFLSGCDDISPPPDPYEYVIHNSLGYVWPAEGRYIQVAIDNLSGPGDVWLPKAIMSVPGLKIKNSGVHIHGYGPEYTVLNFENSNYGIRAARYPDRSPDTLFQWGISDIALEGFTFTNGALFLVIRNNLILNNIVGKDIHTSTAAVRMICPYGEDTNADGWTDSPDAKTENVLVQNVHIIRSSSHGFQLNSVQLKGCIYDGISFINCSSIKAGCWEWPSHGRWSTGFDLAEGYSMPEPSKELNTLTIKNLLVDHCTATEAWESGFHFESRPNKQNVVFRDCVSNNNGQKYSHSEPDCAECSNIINQVDCDAYPNDGCYWHAIGWLGCHQWSSYPYGSGFMCVGENMTLIRCTSLGNGAFGWSPVGTGTIYQDCVSDSYPSSLQGNGWATIPKGYPGGECRSTKNCP